jgi:hypothetical protein
MADASRVVPAVTAIDTTTGWTIVAIQRHGE